MIGKDEAFNNPYKLSQNAITKIIDNTFNTSLSINYSGRKINFSSQSAYQRNYRYYTLPIDADFSPIDGITLDYNYGKDWNNVKVLTQEFKLSNAAASTSPFKWTIGTFYFYQKTPTKTNTHFGNDGTLAGAPDNNFSLINTSKGTGQGIAFYGQATYEVTKKFNFFGGIRYDHEYKKLDILGEYVKDGGPSFPYRTDTSAKANFNAVTPKIGLGFHPKKDLFVYASYSKGFRAGGLTPLSADAKTPALFPFKPEYSNNVEAGIKNTFLADRVSLNLSAFYTTVQDAQVPTLVLPDAVTITKNTGVLHSRGVEAEVSATPAKGIQIIYNAGYTDATYKTLKLAQNGGEINLSGKHPLFTPDYTSMLAAQYTYIPKSEQGLQLMVRGELKSVGTQYFDLANTLEQKSYSLVNASFGVTYKVIQLLFWSRNITEKKYIAYAYDFGGVHLGDPATYGVTLRLKL